MAKRKQTPEMKAGRMARSAAKMIEKHGWAKGTAQDEKGRLCVRAALAVAYNGNYKTWGSDKALEGSCSLLAKWLFPEADSTSDFLVEGWNDTHPKGNPWGIPGIEAHGQPRFPFPTEGHEVVAILNKFADEYDPQGGSPLFIEGRERDGSTRTQVMESYCYVVFVVEDCGDLYCLAEHDREFRTVFLRKYEAEKYVSDNSKLNMEIVRVRFGKVSAGDL